MQGSIYIILLQNSLQVRQSVKYLPCNLRVWENAFVPIILQGAGREEQPSAYLSPCEIEFALKQRTVCLCCYLHALCEVSDARNELFHFGCFFTGGFIFYTRVRDKLSMQIVLTALIFRDKQVEPQVYCQKSNRLLGQNIGS